MSLKIFIKKTLKLILYGVSFITTFVIGYIILTILVIRLYPQGAYNKYATVTTITENAEIKSTNCCAWYVMKALHAGNCYVPILEACEYKQILPEYGFIEIYKGKGSFNQQYTPALGDIVVFERVKKHCFGHIAVWTGKQWVSDFKQKNFLVAKEYSNANYVIFRHK